MWPGGWLGNWPGGWFGDQEPGGGGAFVVEAALSVAGAGSAAFTASLTGGAVPDAAIQSGGHRPIRARTRVLPPQWFDDAAAVLEEELALHMLGMV